MTNATTTNTRIIVFDNPDFGPSRRMLDTVNELVTDRPEIDFEQVDIRKHPDRGVEYDVMSVPTTIIMVDGVEQKRINGLRSPRSLKRALARIGDSATATARSLHGDTTVTA